HSIQEKWFTFHEIFHYYYILLSLNMMSRICMMKKKNPEFYLFIFANARVLFGCLVNEHEVK
ncbi:hypothetical protein OFM39_37400, partial [Escherichia coli]|nr:hypothetical protein [Escherichia coli]